MAGLDERLHDLVAAAGREVPVPSPDGVRRRGTRRRVIRSGAGGLAVVLLAVGCVVGIHVTRGADRADIQPSTSDLPSGVQIEILPSAGNNHQDLKVIEDQGVLTVADVDDASTHDLWSFPQPDPSQKLYQIELDRPGSPGGCVSTRTDTTGSPVLTPCNATDASQLWEITSSWDTVKIRALGPLLGQDDGTDLQALLVQPAGAPDPTGTSSPLDTVTPSADDTGNPSPAAT